MGTHPIFESDFDCLTENFHKMAKSLRSKRMRKNRALQGEKKAPRVLKRMKEAMAAGKAHNDMVAAEKLKTVDSVMDDEDKHIEEGDATMAASGKQMNETTGINTDGSKPVWMSDRKFKKIKAGMKGQKRSKFEPNKFGIGPHKKVLRTARKKKTKK